VSLSKYRQLPESGITKQKLARSLKGIMKGRCPIDISMDKWNPSTIIEGHPQGPLL
jgi:hypothetical protein